MDLASLDLSSISPFYLLRVFNLSHAQILEVQNKLRESGKSLWDWTSYSYLYKDQIAQIIDSPWPRNTLEGLSEKVSGSPDNVVVIAKCMDQLTMKQREVLNLLYLEDHRVGDIADMLGISLNAVYVRKQRATDHLRQLWQLHSMF